MNQQPLNIINDKIREVLGKFPQIVFATVFGSAASGRITSLSDVDIAIAGERELPYETKIDLCVSLSKALNHEVDLIDLHAVSGLILKEALCSGTIIHRENPAIYAGLLKKMWYNQQDMMPHYRRILKNNCERFING